MLGEYFDGRLVFNILLIRSRPVHLYSLHMTTYDSYLELIKSFHPEDKREQACVGRCVLELTEKVRFSVGYLSSLSVWKWYNDEWLRDRWKKNWKLLRKSTAA
jgi:hypothetical protein